MSPIRRTDDAWMLTCLGRDPSLEDFTMHFCCARDNLEQAWQAYQAEPSMFHVDNVLVWARILVEALREVLKEWNPTEPPEWKQQRSLCKRTIRKFDKDYLAVCHRPVHGPPRENWQRGETGYEAWDRYILLRSRRDPEKDGEWFRSLLELLGRLNEVSFYEPPVSE